MTEAAGADGTDSAGPSLDGIRLGFGTASLLGPRGHAEAVRLLDAAVDTGIAYIDTARMYGSGGAEAVVGEVARRHRDRMIIATKAGILPPAGNLAARLARKLARMARQPEPRFAAPEFHVFDPARFRASVECSLAELGVDHIDVLLLHEAGPDDITPALLAGLADLTREGKIGAIGLATEPEPTVAILREHPGVFSVAQVPSNLWRPNVAAVRAAGAKHVGAHSIMGTRFQNLVQRLRADPALCATASRRLGGDAGDAGFLGRMFMMEALSANPDGFVLFSSGNPANMAANVALAVETPPLADEAREALVELAAMA